MTRLRPINTSLARRLAASEVIVHGGGRSYFDPVVAIDVAAFMMIAATGAGRDT